ncbi:M23 family metallopeptidase [Myxococcaceae bacterium GXIMD 01537]
MAGCEASRAGGALLVLLGVVLGASGCTSSRAAARPDGAPPPASARAAAAPAGPPVELSPAHAEPELVGRHHRVAPSETMYRIARTYGITVEELAAANGIKDPRTLTVGQELLIPAVMPPEPEPAAGSGKEASTPGRPRGDAVAGGRDFSRPPPRPASRPAPTVSRKPQPATKGLLDWPLRGVLYGRFGKKGREPHDGIDLAAPEGTPVRAAQEGTVLYAGEQRGYGHIVIVQHTGGLVTLYAHNKDLRVVTGQKVRREQVVATVGESGRTSGPHLHFEVRVEGKPVDPLDYLGPLPSS